ncbi:MAG: HEPN domain-containing protein [Dehalococcoidia bacterium]
MSAVAELIPAMAERIVHQFDPLRIILFGSQARGDASPASDVDLLVILPQGIDERRAAIEIGRALSEFAVSTDVIVSTPAEIQRRGDLVGTVFRPALREGRVLYDQKPETAKRGVPPVSKDEVLAETRGWLDDANGDLLMASFAIARPELPFPQAGFHAQQAAEKALKAIYVFLQIDYPLTHNLDLLREGIPVGWRLKSEYPDLKALSEWAVELRYPTRRTSVSREDARRAVEQAQGLVAAAERDLREHGLDPREQ